MEDIRIKIKKISEQLEKVDDNNYQTTIPLLEKMVEYHQILGDIDNEFSYRKRYVDKLSKVDIEKMIFEFSVLVTHFDQNIDHLSDFNVESFYDCYLDNVLENIFKSEKITLSQIDGLWDDFLKRAVKTDKILRLMAVFFAKKIVNTEPKRLAAAYYTAWCLYNYTGQFDKTNAFFDLWHIHFMPKEHNLGECTEKISNKIVYYLLWKGDFKQAIKKGEELIESNVSCSCMYLPMATRGFLLIAYLSIGNDKKAEEHYELAKDHTDIYSPIIYWNIRKNEFSRALDQFEKYVSDGFQNISFDNMFSFHLGYVLFHNMLKEKGDISLSVKLPENMGLFRANHTYSVNTLKDYFQKQTKDLILAFDKRNQNTVVSDYFNNLEKIFLN